MSEAKKSKWERQYKSDDGAGVAFSLIASDNPLAYVDQDGLNVHFSGALTPDEALALAAWITAWFGTEVKP